MHFGRDERSVEVVTSWGELAGGLGLLVLAVAIFPLAGAGVGLLAAASLIFAAVLVASALRNA